jgi:hypothetical protein
MIRSTVPLLSSDDAAERDESTLAESRIGFGSTLDDTASTKPAL